MLTVLIICIIIVIIVLLLAVLTTSKAYSYKHTVDTLENNPNLQTKTNDNDEHNGEQK